MTLRRQPRAALAAMAAATILLLFAAPAGAQERDHSGGFFLRLSAGGGAAATEAADGGMTIRFSGPAGDANFAIGGIVAQDLALHGTLFGWTISDPDVEVNGSTFSGDGELSLGALGAGLTYYFMPANIYVSGSLGFGRLSYKRGGMSGESSTGLAFDATVGKEWWVGDSWGLGVALGLGMHAVPEEGVDDSWSGGNVSVRFTATMN